MGTPTHVSPHAETVASQGGSAPPLPARSHALVIGLAITAAIAIAATVVLATRGGGKSTRAPVAVVAADAAPAAITPDAAESHERIAVDDAAVEEVAVDAGVAVTTPDAPATTRADGPRRHTGKTVAARPNDPVVAEDLRKARGALRTGQHALAKQFCNSVLNSRLASPFQENQALLLRGDIYCNHEKQIGLARADLRQMTSSVHRARLLKRCPDLR